MRTLYLPQYPALVNGAPGLSQAMEDGYLPVILTSYTTAQQVVLEQKVLATTLGLRQRSVVLARFQVKPLGSAFVKGWLCLAVVPTGPTGFERHDKAGRISDKRLSFLKPLAHSDRINK